MILIVYREMIRSPGRRKIIFLLLTYIQIYEKVTRAEFWEISLVLANER
jgi:hypothetical protein